MKLSIITVTWNNQEQITTLIESVQAACENLSFEHFVVDNASKDNTVKIVERYEQVRLIKNDTNSGFGHANNQALADSTGEYILFLNPDMQLQPGSLDTMVAWMESNPDIGLASPKLVDEHGNLNLDATPRRFPRLWEQLALLLKVPHLFPRVLDRYHMRGFNSEKEQDVDSVRGAFMLIRREITDKLGWGFDPRYYFWYEDVDTCREVWAMGKRVVYTPVITAVDFVGQSFKQRTSMWKQKQFTKSMLQYFQKWEAWYTWVWILLFRPVGIFMVWVSNKVGK